MSTMGNEPRNFADVRERLEDIVVQVRSKELSLEKSLDLYEEAIRLGNCALTFVYKPEFSPEEAEILQSVRDSTSAIADSISAGRDGISEEEVASVTEDASGVSLEGEQV